MMSEFNPFTGNTWNIFKITCTELQRTLWIDQVIFYQILGYFRLLESLKQSYDFHMKELRWLETLLYIAKNYSYVAPTVVGLYKYFKDIILFF